MGDDEKQQRVARFDRDIAVDATGPGRYSARIDRGWWIVRGPNGGYLAAMLLHAIRTELADTARTPRSMTVHFTSPPEEGTVEIEVSVERSGRSMSTVTARIIQGGRLCALAIAALSKPRTAETFCDLTMPQVEPPEALAPPARPNVGALPELGIHARYEQRQAIGAPLFEVGEEALSGGWIRLAEPRPIDAVLIAALADAWRPAVFTRIPPGEGFRGVPTIDLSIHFRNDVASLALPDPTWLLVRFSTRCAAEGFLEEDGEVWAPDGTLLAQSRQLGVLL